MKPEEMIALAEKYEAWIGSEMPECIAREYRAIAEGLRMLAGNRSLLQFILDGAENVDLNHRDFRIQVAQMAQVEMDKTAPITRPERGVGQ